MKNLIIVGAGDFGREVLDWALAIPEEKRDWKVAGFLDDNPDILMNYDTGLKILGCPSTYNLHKNDVFIIAIGNPASRKKIARLLTERGGTFTQVIHPSAVIGSRCKVGVGAIICPRVVITTDIHIGDFVIVNVASSIGHNSFIGDFCTVSPHCAIMGHSTIEEDVFFGVCAHCVPNITIERGAIVGAGSTVYRRVEKHSTVFTTPAKKLK